MHNKLWLLLCSHIKMHLNSISLSYSLWDLAAVMYKWTIKSSNSHDFFISWLPYSFCAFSFAWPRNFVTYAYLHTKPHSALPGKRKQEILRRMKSLYLWDHSSKHNCLKLINRYLCTFWTDTCTAITEQSKKRWCACPL